MTIYANYDNIYDNIYIYGSNTATVAKITIKSSRKVEGINIHWIFNKIPDPNPNRNLDVVVRNYNNSN